MTEERKVRCAALVEKKKEPCDENVVMKENHENMSMNIENFIILVN